MTNELFDVLLGHLEKVANGEEHPEFSPKVVQNAVVNLLCRVVLADGSVLPEEVLSLEKMINEHLGEHDIDWRNILSSPERGASVINEPAFAAAAILKQMLDVENRRLIVDMMIDIALSDGDFNENETVFINHVSNLLEVKQRQVRQSELAQAAE